MQWTPVERINLPQASGVNVTSELDRKLGVAGWSFDSGIRKGCR